MNTKVIWKKSHNKTCSQVYVKEALLITTTSNIDKDNGAHRLGRKRRTRG